jgi:putative selenium metabolism hydrolase
VAFDAHLDTVAVTDRDLWSSDPFGGEIRDGCLYGRGAVDQKAGMAALVHAGGLIKSIGLAPGFQIWMVGSVLEEDCDGLCWHYLLQEKVLSPELVVSTEPTGLKLSRGQRGRMEIRVRATGRSSHGAMPEHGENAIYKLAPAVGAIADLDSRLAVDPFLGKGTCTVTWFSSRGPSLCAVPDHAELHIDRRLTTGETLESALTEVTEALAIAQVPAEVFTLTFEEPSWTGLVYPMEKYYPTWVLPPDHPALMSAGRAFGDLFGREPEVSRWLFSTNGVAITGLHGVPCIGFGPGREELAHSRDEHVPLDDVVKACAFYAALGDYLT